MTSKNSSQLIIIWLRWYVNLYVILSSFKFFQYVVDLSSVVHSTSGVTDTGAHHGVMGGDGATRPVGAAVGWEWGVDEVWEVEEKVERKARDRESRVGD